MRSLGCYSEVVTYDDVTSLDPEPVTVMVDMAGDGPVLQRIHAHLDDRPASVLDDGRDQPSRRPTSGRHGGARAAVLLRPSQVAKRLGDWGAEVYEQRLDEASARFSEWSHSWLEVRRVVGVPALESIYADVVAGRVPPGGGDHRVGARFGLSDHGRRLPTLARRLTPGAG